MQIVLVYLEWFWRKEARKNGRTFRSRGKVSRRSADAAAGFCEEKKKRKKETTAVKHKKAGNYRSGRPNNSSNNCSPCQ